MLARIIIRSIYCWCKVIQVSIFYYYYFIDVKYLMMVSFHLWFFFFRLYFLYMLEIKRYLRNLNLILFESMSGWSCKMSIIYTKIKYIFRPCQIHKIWISSIQIFLFLFLPLARFGCMWTYNDFYRLNI